MKIYSFFEHLLENAQEAYREHFREILAEEGYGSLADIPAEKKKEFFQKVSSTWKNKKTANESLFIDITSLGTNQLSALGKDLVDAGFTYDNDKNRIKITSGYNDPTAGSKLDSILQKHRVEKIFEKILKEYAEICPVCHGHSTPSKIWYEDKKCKGCGNYVHVDSDAAVKESKEKEIEFDNIHITNDNIESYREILAEFLKSFRKKDLKTVLNDYFDSEDLQSWISVGYSTTQLSIDIQNWISNIDIREFEEFLINLKYKHDKQYSNFLKFAKNKRGKVAGKITGVLEMNLYDISDKISQTVDVNYVESEGEDVLRIDFPGEKSLWLYSNKQAEGHVSAKVKKILDEEGFKITKL